MLKFFEKYWKIILFASILALAIFLRVWHFHDWLFFKMDQARDAFLIRHALENGPGWLPLLGPKAGGTHLNLGPAFYYFQYIPAFLFQSAHPAVLAYSDLFFAVLSILLFYFFAKKYFSRDWSLVLTSLYEVCFLGIQYSRFAWNPNSLVFFNLLFFLALLNVFDEKKKNKLRWVVIAGLSFAISTQLHFLSFGTLPVIAAIFAVINRQEIKKYVGWKNAVLFIAVVLIAYFPVFLNEFVTHGKNTAAFFEALKEKPSSHSLWQNINRNVRYWGQNWTLVATSFISKKGNLWSSAIAWIALILPGLVLAGKFYRDEEDNLKRKFLLLSILWFCIYFLIYIPIAYQIRPRFFLPLMALPFVFVGYIAKFFWEKNSKILKSLAILYLIGILAGNLFGTGLWFKEINAAQKKGIYPQRTIILKAKDGIVLWHLEKAVEFMKDDCDCNNIFIKTNAEYKSPVKYLLSRKGLNAFSLDSLSGENKGCFYAFGLTRVKKVDLNDSEKEKYDVVSQNKFGALTVYKLHPKILGGSEPKKNSENSNRVFWKDIMK